MRWCLIRKTEIILFQTRKGLVLGSCCRDTGRAQGDDPDISRVHCSLSLRAGPASLYLMQEPRSPLLWLLMVLSYLHISHFLEHPFSALWSQSSLLFFSPSLYFTWPLNVYVFYGSDLGHSPKFKLWER